MKEKILIGSKNKYKQSKLESIAEDYFIPVLQSDLPEVEERGNSFVEVAENKALSYSRSFNGFAISSDGGAIIPSLEDWDPLKTRRFFGGNDFERIHRLLEIMKGKKDRRVEWYEAIALAKDGTLLFSTQAKAMNGVIDDSFNPEFYQDGIWLCSITSFPELGGRNYFQLNDQEKALTENSWDELKISFRNFILNRRR